MSQPPDTVQLGDKVFRVANPRVSRQGLAALPSTVQFGDTGRVRDLRTSAVQFSDWRGGMGERVYNLAAEGLTGFTDSDGDTRFAEALVCPPLAVSRGTLGGSTVGERDWFVEEAGALVAWPRNAPEGPQYRTATGTWAPTTFTRTDGTTFTPGGILQFARYRGRYFLAHYGGTGAGLAHSTDGITWAASPRVTAGARGVCTHDNKLYFWNVATGVVEWTQDPTSTDPNAYSQSQVPYLDPGEVVHQLVEWHSRDGKRVYLLTNQRILWMDEPSYAWHEFWDFNHLAYGEITQLHVSQRDQNLYLIFSGGQRNNDDTMLQFNGGNIPLFSPNKRGGLAPDRQFTMLRLTSNNRWMFGWGARRAGGTGTGRTFAWNEQGFHTIRRDPTLRTVGGGFDGNRLWTVYENGAVVEQEVPDADDHPARVAGRQYEAGSFPHETAWIDLGTKLLPEIALRSTVDVQSGDVRGMPAGAAVKLEYQIDRSGNWLSYSHIKTAAGLVALTDGTLTAAHPWPAVALLAGETGVSCREIKLRLTLTRGTATTASPINTGLSLESHRKPKKRYRYTLQIDAREEFGRNSPGGIREELDDIADGGLVPATFYRGSNLVRLAAADVDLAATEDAGDGTGIITVTVVDMSAEPSG